jgi:AcrR family transcriptional regulator
VAQAARQIRAARPTQAERGGRTQAERRDDAERRILVAAAELVGEQGFEALTLAQVGDRAGCSRGLPSHYFRTKEDLLSALGTFIVETFAERRRASAEGLTGFEALITSIRYYLQPPQQSAKTVRAFHAVLAGAIHMPVLAVTVARLNKEARADIAARLREGIDSGVARPDMDPEIEAALILATLRGAVAQWLLDPEDVDLPRMADRFLSNLQKDLGR